MSHNFRVFIHKLRAFILYVYFYVTFNLYDRFEDIFNNFFISNENNGALHTRKNRQKKVTVK